MPESSGPRLIVNALEELPAVQQTQVRGKKVLVLLAASGIVAQEALRPAEILEQHGCDVVFCALDGGAPRFDPVCNVFAVICALWDPTLRLIRRYRREGRLTALASLREMERRGTLAAWLDGFDSIYVPGGHGQTFNAFARDPLIVDTVASIHASGRPVGLICHAPIIAALQGRWPAWIKGRTVACWPRGFEIAYSLIPMTGRYLMPLGRPVGRLVDDAGATVHDSVLPRRRVHAVIDGLLVTARGPWSMGAFAHALLHVLATRGPRPTPSWIDWKRPMSLQTP